MLLKPVHGMFLPHKMCPCHGSHLKTPEHTLWQISKPGYVSSGLNQ